MINKKWSYHTNFSISVVLNRCFMPVEKFAARFLSVSNKSTSSSTSFILLLARFNRVICTLRFSFADRFP